MDFNIHDATGLWVALVENPTSAIWARRYKETNDFELYFPASAEILGLLTDDCYITCEGRPEVMIVERIEIITDAEDGDYVRIAGRGAESVLDRRVVWEQTALKGRADAAVQKLVTDNAIAPANPARALPLLMNPPALPGFSVGWELGTITTDNGQDNASTTRFRGAAYMPIGNGLHISCAATQRIHLYYYDADLNYLGATGWHAVTGYTITPATYNGAVYVRVIVSNRDNAAISDLAAAASTVSVQHGISTQYTGTGLLEAAQEICAAYGLGIRAVYDDIGQVTPRIEVFEGTDRSERQIINSPVIFSEEFENLLSTNYVLDTVNYKNVALVAGEGEGKARKHAVYGNAAGMTRREIFVDARDVSSNDGEISETEYTEQLTARGAERIAGHTAYEAFDGEIDSNNTFILDVDYTLGDIVTIENKYGIRKNVRISTIVETWDDIGYTVMPMYENLEV